RTADIRPCVGANVCINSVMDGRVVRCVANPDLGTPYDGVAIERDAGGERAAVVGAGPAGLEAARVLGSRGFDVVLFEREPVLGGQLARWAIGSMRELRGLVSWSERTLESLGVDIRRGADASVDDVVGVDPALVVVATGSVPDPAPVAGDASVRQAGLW